MKTTVLTTIAFVCMTLAFFTGCNRETAGPLAAQTPETTDTEAIYTEATDTETTTEPTELATDPSTFPLLVHAVNITVPMGTPVIPMDMIEAADPVGFAQFINPPDIFRSGNQTVEIEVTDAANRRGVFTATLTVLPNDIPPTITGVADITVSTRSTLLLRQNVAAHDAFGRPLDFFIDSHQVDVDTPGRYPIVYYTYDDCGNRTEVAATVTVTSVDIDEVYRRIDNILAGITTDEASQVEQARAVHTWMTRNMTYAATIGLTGRYENADQGLRHRSGNCFVYFYTAEMMLTRLGIPNLRVDRLGGETNHRWHLINPDELGWHHFDTSPHHLSVAAQVDTFMFTSTQAAAYTQLIEDRLGRSHYYAYDPALLPEITP
ncbi:MAG: hypothetical protein FWG38_06130 [Defluviitaleaceae bacterium]|nr:hypothetical protein [Defluviitaleaceae bacterium]